MGLRHAGAGSAVLASQAIAVLLKSAHLSSAIHTALFVGDDFMRRAGPSAQTFVNINALALALTDLLPQGEWDDLSLALPRADEADPLDLTMAYVGTHGLFERAGFAKAANTDSVLNGFPRVLMRLDLR